MAFSFNSRSHAEQLNRLINEQKSMQRCHISSKRKWIISGLQNNKRQTELDRKFEE